MKYIKRNKRKLTLVLVESAHQSEVLNSFLEHFLPQLCFTVNIGFSLYGKSVNHIMPIFSIQPLNR